MCSDIGHDISKRDHENKDGEALSSDIGKDICYRDHNSDDERYSDISRDISYHDDNGDNKVHVGISATISPNITRTTEMMAGVHIYLIFSICLPILHDHILPILHDHILTYFDVVRAGQQRSEVQIQTHLMTTNCIFFGHDVHGLEF
jgi:hypothetical protein